MEIRTQVKGSSATLEVEGRLSVKTSPELEKKVNNLDESITQLTIDLSGTEYVASAGLRVLVAADKLMTSRKGKLTLRHPTEGVFEVLDMTGLVEVFTIER